MGKFIYGYLMTLGNWSLPENCELVIVDDKMYSILGFEIGRTISSEKIYRIPDIPDKKDLDMSIDYSVPSYRQFFVTRLPSLWFVV